MNTETQKPVQPELIWVDEKNLKKEGINLLRSQTALNKFIKECENVLKTELSEDLKIKLKDLKASALITELRKQFSFPNATDDFNLQSLGVDLNNAKRLSSAEYWELYQFELNEMGEFVATEHQTMFNQFYHYAVSDRRKRVLKLAQKLVDLTNEAAELDVLEGQVLGPMTMAFKQIVTLTGEPGRPSARLVVYKEAIAHTIR